MALAAIELKNVSIAFDTENSKDAQEVILENVSIKIHDGDRIVFIGPSGQGKSVLMKVMAGLIPPTTGQVLIYGEDLYAASNTRKQQIMCQMGMLFQKNALFDSQTNAENIAFPLREVTEFSEEKIAQKVEYFLNAVGILHARALYPDEISGGMQKRLGIARALALNPKIIFYDDPTAGLDPITSRKIIELILNFAKAENSILLAVTNEMNRAYQLAGRIAMVFNKTLIETGNPLATQHHQNPVVKQFVKGEVHGPLTGVE